MYILKRMAIREDRERSKKAGAFAKNFIKIVTKYGRNREAELLARYTLETNPFGGIAQAPVGLALFMRGRMPLGGGKVRQIESLRKIVKKALELGGE
jgi:hypothetical protein